MDGKVVATQTMERAIPLTLPWDETFDLGSDTRTPVDDGDYQVPFAFNGKIDKLTFVIEPPILTEDQATPRRQCRNSLAISAEVLLNMSSMFRARAPMRSRSSNCIPVKPLSASASGTKKTVGFSKPNPNMNPVPDISQTITSAIAHKTGNSRTASRW